ncbi:diacylglycerol/lipid kinase family protein [Myceligenerans xiligouense]|uniref:Diacylglycerol kinase family enzyme n=1 Tax=Myceligenerans xiligouense TaxID=253184 RepID=A0A3N4Z372_9MICO|nr:diacylglycerol kinase family protein [Myceligenerans xiligouense]RPF20428.1 diacylglycerol kinase family enzyme [Myceligenerans xiligouense]
MSPYRGRARSRTAPPTSGERAVVVVNPVRTDIARLRAAVTLEERKRGWQPHLWFETTADDAGGQAARAALRYGPAVVIVAGGDGTIRAVAEVVERSGTPLAIVPAGTGNLLARDLGLLTGLEASVRTAFTGADRPIDVGVAELEREDGTVSTHLFLVMTGIGLDASMATGTSTTLKRRIGWLAYVDPISRSVLGNQRFSLHYRVDGGPERSIQAHTVIVGNCGTLTAGMLLLPDAEVDDGLLDVVLLRPEGFWQWLEVGSRLTLGGLLKRTDRGRVVLRAAPRLRAMEYVRGARFAARFDSPQDIELDGDSFGAVTAARIGLRPGALLVRRADPASARIGRPTAHA